MVDDEGIGGELDGDDTETESVDVPVRERVLIVGGGYALGKL